ncbi:dUTP diphosphatase [Tropicimonas marinistellae]|uniref:dUTP diphosphatase n=1 Tax=Tropicimonas marinistellae TaxID=1739787 RepID=UPI00082E6167|nr:dUTP diphosphatase [Tropicimonas marinistellae]
MSVVVKVLREDWADPEVALPSYETSGAAGADIRANLPETQRAEGLTLAPLERQIVPSGLRIEIPAGYEVQIRPRSGLAYRHGISLPNTPGTIDSDYRGPLGILLVNLGTEAYTIQHGDRVAQMIVAPVIQARFDAVSGLGHSQRGDGGFGSTGRG